MRIVITLTDDESGHVHITTSPPGPKMVRIAKSEREKITPALAYAMKALSSIVKDSVEQGQKEGIIPEGIIKPTALVTRGNA
jgi:hypothetical protein